MAVFFDLSFDALGGRFEFYDTYLADPRPHKLFMMTGIYVDAEGRCGAFESVRAAERQVLHGERSRDYLMPLGSKAFRDAVTELVFGAKCDLEVLTAQTPGGSAALRLLGQAIALQEGRKLWLPRMTWGNHHRIFRHAGVTVEQYSYETQGQTRVNLGRALDDLEAASPGDYVLFHGSCHNPTGIDLDASQWSAAAEAIARRSLIPVIDIAFLGYSLGIERELDGVRALLKRCGHGIVALSLGKTFGLYNERVGALLVTAPGGERLDGVHRVLEGLIRGLWSSPPAHGARLVTQVLATPSLRQSWEDHLEGISRRIRAQRARFVENMAQLGVRRDYGHVLREAGLFTRTGLGADDTRWLREHEGVYIGPSGYANLGVLTAPQLDYFCGRCAPLLRARA